MSETASNITGVSIVCSIVCSAADHKNTKVPYHWTLGGESTSDRWIPLTRGQWHGKCFHLMTSSCHANHSWQHVETRHFPNNIFKCIFLWRAIQPWISKKLFTIMRIAFLHQIVAHDGFEFLIYEYRCNMQAISQFIPFCVEVIT